MTPAQFHAGFEGFAEMHRKPAEGPSDADFYRALADEDERRAKAH